MERLKAMKEQLIGVVQGQLANIAQVDAHELGEVVDMIKDFDEAMYYCAIVKEMEERKKEEKEYGGRRHYMMPYYGDDYYDQRDMDRHMGRMYYGGNSSGGSSNSSGSGSSSGGGRGGNGGGRGQSGSSSSGGRGGSSSYYHEYEYPYDMTMRDSREGRSPMSRRTYMEAKELHKDKDTKVHELEHYMQELSEDITEMITDASPEEMQMLEKKITALASKIAQLNG